MYDKKKYIIKHWYDKTQKFNVIIILTNALTKDLEAIQEDSGS